MDNDFFNLVESYRLVHEIKDNKLELVAPTNTMAKVSNKVLFELNDRFAKNIPSLRGLIQSTYAKIKSLTGTSEYMQIAVAMNECINIVEGELRKNGYNEEDFYDVIDKSRQIMDSLVQQVNNFKDYNQI